MRFPPTGILVAALLTLPFSAACNQNHASSPAAAGSAMLNVRLKDAPIDLSNVQSVMVTLTGVILYPADSSPTLPMPSPTTDMEQGGPAPITLMNHPATFDLLTLTGGASALLASGDVPAGNYGRIRLEISDASLVYKDGTSAPLMIESNKVDIPIEFTLTVNTDQTVTLDFNAAASVQVNATAAGTFILRPVVTPSLSS